MGIKIWNTDISKIYIWQTVVTPPTSYRYIKRTITDNRNHSTVTQMSEFEICDNNWTKMSRPSGTSITWNIIWPWSETVDKIIDWSTSTKYCPNGSLPIIITIDLGTTVDFTTYNKYKRYTANDASQRDPISWNIALSNDWNEWITVSSVSNANITTNRYALAWTWDIVIPTPSPYKNIKKVYLGSTQIRPPVSSERADIDSFSLTTTKSSWLWSRLHAIATWDSGAKFYLWQSTTTLYQYNVTNWDLSNYSNSYSSSISYQSRWQWCNGDGSRLYVSHDNWSIYEIRMTTPYSLSGANASTYSVGNSCCGVSLSWDGTKLYHGGWWFPRTLYEYTLSTPFDASTLSSPTTHTVSAISATSWDNSYIYQTAISPSGKKMYFSADWGKIYQYNLSTAYDWSTATYYGFMDTWLWGRASFSFRNDGQRLYVAQVGNSSGNLYQYDV